jgi:hypothetical protein
VRIEELNTCPGRVIAIVNIIESFCPNTIVNAQAMDGDELNIVNALAEE